MTRKIKDSGVDWIGEIPEDWEVSKYKRFTTNGMGSTILKEDLINSGIPVYSATKDSLVFGYLENPKIKLEKGDFIIPARGNSIGYVYMIKDKLATCTQTTIYSKINNDINKKYLLYQSKGLKDYWFEFDNTAIPQITVEQVANNRVLVPSMSEQNSIADFLDKKTQEIDNIISKTKKAIEEYKKYKQSLITETVTKGLDENVEMKDSGIEWIGEIPEHWDVARLKYLIKGTLKYGANSSGCSFNENLPRYIRITDISKENELKYTDKLSIDLKESSEFILKDKDILFARSGATVGKTFLYKEEMGLSAFAGYLIRARIDSNNLSEFVYYITLSSYYEKWKDSILIQATIENIGADKYNNLIITVPPVEEQKEIMRFLDKKCSQIDKIISTKEKLLSEMEAYKKSLIYETVTGKREVE